VHRCLGSHLARMEMRLVYEEWHKLIPDYEIAAGAVPRVKWPQGTLGLEAPPFVFPRRARDEGHDRPGPVCRPRPPAFDGELAGELVTSARRAAGSCPEQAIAITGDMAVRS
jgi:hypothetical protein